MHFTYANREFTTVVAIKPYNSKQPGKKAAYSVYLTPSQFIMKGSRGWGWGGWRQELKQTPSTGTAY